VADTGIQRALVDFDTLPDGPPAVRSPVGERRSRVRLRWQQSDWFDLRGRYLPR